MKLSEEMKNIIEIIIKKIHEYEYKAHNTQIKTEANMWYERKMGLYELLPYAKEYEEFIKNKVEQLEQQNKELIEENKKLKENKLCVSCFNYKFCAPTKIYKSFEILENQINDK